MRKSSEADAGYISGSIRKYAPDFGVGAEKTR
jgi:hypothetical protein